MAHIGTSDDEAVGMNRIRRIGHQHGIARGHGGHGQVREPLLAADGDNGLSLGVERDSVAVLIPAADGAAQARDAARDRIAMGIAALGNLNQLVDDMLGRRLIWIAHAEVDDILAARSRRCLQLIDNVENIGRKPLDAAKVGLRRDHGGTSQWVSERERLAV